MATKRRKLSRALAGLIFAVALLHCAKARSQSIIPAADGTATIVNQNNNQYNISGGTQAGNNLFHSLQQFGLTPGEIANFLSSPDIQNILARVVGGSPSNIAGLIQVTGGNSNLFLLNPAGIIFNPGASLNVPGDFTATTANGIQLGNQWFSTSTNVDTIRNLIGTPNALGFTVTQPGAIINQANLAVNPGKNILLAGGTVIQLGTMSAPGGNIIIAAVPGEKLIRLTQAGSLLSLDLPIETKQIIDGSEQPLTPLSLPQLLANDLDSAKAVIVNSDGTVQLTGSGLTINSGDVAIAGTTTAQNITLLAANRVNPTDPNLIKTFDGIASTPTVILTPAAGSNKNDYVFLDATVKNYQSLLYGGKPGTTTIAIAPFEHGISKITSAVNGITGITNLHIISEGDTGNFWLGKDFVNTDHLGLYSSDLQSWKSSLASSAGILLYACNAAKGLEGMQFVNQLQQLAGVNIAASSDRTGNSLLGGNWNLEYQTGAINLDLALRPEVMQNYQNTLATLTVTNILDSSAGSLRDQILAAALGDTIVFDTTGVFGTAQTITLTSTLTIGQDLTINGTGANNLTVSGNNTVQVFDIPAGTVDIDGMTITNGKTSANGGGILVGSDATLNLTNSNVSGNSATNGGGIYNNGRATITNSTISGNSATNGGSIYSVNATVTITNSTISGNSATNGGGIYNLNATATIANNSTISGNSATNGGGIYNKGTTTTTITDSTVSGNSSSNRGGGIYNGGTATATITDSTISGNSAPNGGGIFNEGTIAVTSSTISGNSSSNRGSGIYNRATATVANSTINGNSATNFGGGIFNFGVSGTATFTLTNSTISGNSASSGGGIGNSSSSAPASLTVTNSTISGNSATNGGGIFNSVVSAAIAVGNSIVAGNNATTGTDINISSGTFTSSGNNLFGQNGSAGIVGASPIASDLVLAGAIGTAIFPLGNYGGTTQTHALVPGSVAINAGNNASAPATDQRGAARIVGGTIDIGAYESAGFSLMPTGTPQSTQINTAFPTSLSVQLVESTFNQPLAWAGLSVTFSAPTSGASGTFANGSNVITNASGVATNSITANAIAGNFTVTASAVGTTAASFDLTNTNTPVTPVAPVAPVAPSSTPSSSSSSPLLINPVDLSQVKSTVPDQLILGNPPPELAINLNDETVEEIFSTQYAEYLGTNKTSTISLDQAQSVLQQIEQATGIKPALIYALFIPASTSVQNYPEAIKKNRKVTGNRAAEIWQFNSSGLIANQEPAINKKNPDNASDRLELVLITSQGKPIRRPVAETTRSQVLKIVQASHNITDLRNSRGYLAPMQQLYQLLVAPLEPDLQALQIKNLAFIMDSGLRSIPLAAMHDGKNFIIEKYSVGLMPSLSLTDTRYRRLQDVQALAMGAEKFNQLNSLPAVPTELQAIASRVWQGKVYLNEQFTIENLQQARASESYGIVHLATHGEFNPGKPSNSYIQFWNKQLSLDKLRELGLNNPPTELLVLSACRSALGDEEAELGFAGLAVQAGVKSALGSLWYVSDAGTLALMAGFYENLKRVPTKSEALRLAQLAMLKGQVKLQNGQLITPDGNIPLPPDLAKLGNANLSHPYYWSAFTMIGSPW